jgi:thiol-disulfide isomerase/thioredoxin
MLRNAVIGLLALAIVLIHGGDASAADRCTSPPPSLGKWQLATSPVSVPDQPWWDEAGNERRLADNRGKALVINFWATWCAPCVKEMPALDRLRAALAPDGIEVLALSADREGVPVVRKFYDVNGLTHLAVALDRMGRIARPLGVQGLPTTVVFDRAGREVGRVVGVAEWDDPATIAFLRRCLAQTGGAT